MAALTQQCTSVPKALHLLGKQFTDNTPQMSPSLLNGLNNSLSVRALAIDAME